MPADRRRSGRTSLPTPASPEQMSKSPSAPAASIAGVPTPKSPLHAHGAAQTADRLRSILSPPKGTGSEASTNAGRRLQFSDSIEARTFAIGDRAGPGAPAGRRIASRSPATKRKSSDTMTEPESSNPVASGSQTADSPPAQPSRPKRIRHSDARPQSLQRLAGAARAALPTPPPSEPSTSAAAAGKKASTSPSALPTPSTSASSSHFEGRAPVSRISAAEDARRAAVASEEELSSVSSASEDDSRTRRRPRVKQGRKINSKAPMASRLKPPLDSYVKRLALPDPIGPAADKVYLAEGLFTNRSINTRFPGFPNGIDKTGKPAPYKPAALAAVLNDVEAKPMTISAGEKPAKARPSKAWVTILPDGTQIEGKLPRHASASETLQPAQAIVKGRKGSGRYVWVTELPDGSTVDGLLPIPKTEDGDEAEAPAAEEEEVEEVILGAAASDETESDEPRVVRRTTRSRSGRTSLPAPVKTQAVDLTFQPFSGLRRSRHSLPGPAASTVTSSPAPSEVAGFASKRRGKASARQSVDVEMPPDMIESPFIFPLPTTFRDAPEILTDSRPFHLTYDIIWEWENGGLEQQKKPKPFKTITKNVFPDRARDLANASICDCKPPPLESDEMGCGDTCINRALQYLCSPKTCPCGEMCSNKSLFKRTTPSLKVFWTGSRGFGLKAMEDISKGEFVLDYRGEVITLAEYYARIQTVYKGRQDYYALEYGEGEVLDSGMKGNIARFINHGCAPNLRVHKYTTLGEGVEEYEVGFWATRDIRKGEELFYDYNFDSFATRTAAAAMTNAPLPVLAEAPVQTGKKGKAIAPPEPSFLEAGNGRQRCNCGADVCTGWIGGNKAKEKKAAASRAA